MRHVALTLAITACILTGCYTPDTITGEKPPRYASGVSIARFDTTTRPPTKTLDILRTLPPNAKIIARLSRPGAASKEAAMLNAIAFRARQLGADGIVPVTADGDPVNQINVNVVVGHPWSWNEKGQR